VLVLGVNSATRLLTYIVGADKTYEATIRLGSATVTDDAEGETISVAAKVVNAAIRCRLLEKPEKCLAVCVGDYGDVPVLGRPEYGQCEATIRANHRVTVEIPVEVLPFPVDHASLAHEALGLGAGLTRLPSNRSRQ
jgi:hypothetical protein